MKETGLGVTEVFLRFIVYLCLGDDNLYSSNVCIITGPDSSYTVKTQTDPMTNFQYPRRFKMFLDYLEVEGMTTINEQAKIFLLNTETDPKWTEQKSMDFQLQRVSRGENQLSKTITSR